MTTKNTVTLKSILDEHKLEGKVVRRKLREKFAKNHSKGEPWIFTNAELPKVLALIGVTKATPKPKVAKKAKAKPERKTPDATSLVNPVTASPA